MELADFLTGFQRSYPTNFDIRLPLEWNSAILSQIKNFNSPRSCIDFLGMVRMSGEPYVMLLRLDLHNIFFCFIYYFAPQAHNSNLENAGLGILYSKGYYRKR